MSAVTASSGPRARDDRDVIEVEGVVQEHAHGVYKVRCELAGRPHFVVAHPGGKLRANRIHVTVGDRVRVEITPFDLSRGRITWRHR